MAPINQLKIVDEKDEKHTDTKEHGEVYVWSRIAIYYFIDRLLMPIGICIAIIYFLISTGALSIKL